jgi:hypothetical protein
MRNYLVLLIAKYCRLLSAANRLKCGRKVKGSILSTLNRLRASLARYDKAAQGQKVKFKSGLVYGPGRVKLLEMGHAVLPLPTVAHIIRTI